ncbi:uncharacterized protein LOC143218635 [Lasioglossum baleicum]|uniref:uncharacterized protein LOC143218635 n=1 Tax=Lasioglossum baleicum TaxID=434251 RepID=UPI003FCC29C9
MHAISNFSRRIGGHGDMAQLQTMRFSVKEIKTPRKDQFNKILVSLANRIRLDHESNRLRRGREKLLMEYSRGCSSFRCRRLRDAIKPSPARSHVTHMAVLREIRLTLGSTPARSVRAKRVPDHRVHTGFVSRKKSTYQTMSFADSAAFTRGDFDYTEEQKHRVPPVGPTLCATTLPLLGG